MNATATKKGYAKYYEKYTDCWYSFLLEAVDNRDIVRLEGLGQLKKKTQ
jgi:hypothetical protein